MFPSIELFGREFSMYTICAVVGLCFCGAVATWLGKKYKFALDDIVLFILTAALGLIVGGHILYGIVNTPLLIKVIAAIPRLTFKETINYLWAVFGGSVFYGGLFGSLIALRIHIKHSKLENKHMMMNIYAVSVPLFHVFGRIGCFLGGCCYGIESEFGFTVHNNTLVPDINGVSRFPVALLESALNLIIFFILLYAFKKIGETHSLIHLYFFLYSIVRFSTELLRGDAIRGVWGPFSTSQWISLVLFVYTVTRFIVKKAKAKRITQ